MWVNLAALGSCQLHFDNVSWQCLLVCWRFNLCFNKQQIFGRFPCKQKWPAVECCSSSAVDLRFCWSVPRSGAISGWSLLLFCQNATKEKTEEKTARLLHPSQVAYICGRLSVRGTRHRQWLCNEKAIAVLAGRRSEILEGCCKLFPKRRFCWKHLCSFSSKSTYFSTDSLTLFFVFLLLNLFTNCVSAFFYSVSKFSGIQKKTEFALKGYFRTFSNI